MMCWPTLVPYTTPIAVSDHHPSELRRHLRCMYVAAQSLAFSAPPPPFALTRLKILLLHSPVGEDHPRILCFEGAREQGSLQQTTDCCISSGGTAYCIGSNGMLATIRASFRYRSVARVPVIHIKAHLVSIRNCAVGVLIARRGPSRSHACHPDMVGQCTAGTDDGMGRTLLDFAGVV